MVKNKLIIVLVFLFFVWMPETIAQQKQSSSNIAEQRGEASYYGKGFNGRKTSNGEVFCSDSLTAAHKQLKFGTLVRVTNISNDSVVIVRINDRLPKSSKRCIDLSYRSAQQLGFIKKGITQVLIEVIYSPQ